jgi:tape measure domain-containing protein
MAIAGTLQVNVTAKTDAFESGMRKVRTEVQTTQKAVTAAQSGFQQLSTSLVGLTAGVLSVQALSSAMKDVVKVGIEMQNLRQSFAAISGGAQAGNREFAFVVQTANKLGLELQTVAGQYRSLAAATRGTALEGQATRELFVALSNAARAYGLSNEALGRAIQAVQQIASKGKVTMEELRGQLGEALPGAMQILARAFGTTTKGLEDMVTKGLDSTEALKRLTSQLGIEVPQAAARAGSGITQLGNEILMLKDRIAQTGLLRWLDDVQGRLAGLLRTSREAEEKLQQQAEKRLAREMGGGVTPDQLLARDREALTAKTRELADAERRLMDLTKAREERKFGFLTALEIPESAVRAARQEVDRLRQEQQAMQGRLGFQTLERQDLARRKDASTKPFKDQQAASEAVDAANKKLTTTYEGLQSALDNLKKSSHIAPEIYGRETGSLQEQITYLEKRKTLLEDFLKSSTEMQLARDPKMEAIPKDFVAQQENARRQLRETTAGIESAKQAIQDAEKAKQKAIQETEAARRKAAQLAEEERRKDVQQMEEVARVHAQNIDALRSLAARYTDVRAERDADRASMLAASLATSQYAKESRDLADAIADVQRIEAQLPALRSAAKSSAAEFEAIQDIMPDFEPDIQLTRREQLAQRFEDLKRVTSDPGTLANAQRRMEETLVIEKQAEMMEHLNDMAEELTNTFVDMAVTGEINFKRLGESFSRMVLDMVADAIDLKGAISGWLKQGLNAAGGGQGGWLQSFMGGGGGAGTAALQADISASMAASPELFAFGGGMAAGGPVMPGRWYTVGEKGPETFVPGQAGTVIPNGGQTFHMTVVTNDADSFRRNERQVAAQATRLMARARRNL